MKTEGPTIQEIMEAYANDAVAHARDRGVLLDYSEKSLAHVDTILHAMTDGNVLTPGSPAEEEELWPHAFAQRFCDVVHEYTNDLSAHR